MAWSFLNFFKKKRKHYGEYRHISIANKRDYYQKNGERFSRNKIESSKYTIWNFLPKNLFEQLHRIANVYFLLVAAICFVVDTSVNPWTTLAPLIFVMAVTAIKQGYEDLLRHRADDEVNNLKYERMGEGGDMMCVCSKNIHVGDIIQVKCDQDVPCDMVVLRSSEEEGACHITTVNLDGETNIKTYRGIHETSKLDTHGLWLLDGDVVCDHPNENLYEFQGNMCLRRGREEETYALDSSNMILRGTRLRNTEYVTGVVVYTGHQTKISMNSQSKSQKYSRVEKRLNSFLISYIVLLVLVSAGWEMLAFLLHISKEGFDVWYVPASPQISVLEVVRNFFIFMVLFNYIIPISLYVTVEMQKFMGSIFISYDLQMFDPENNEGTTPNTSDLNEELGQIEYLMVDKTGTLTKNQMELKMIYCGGEEEEGEEEKGEGARSGGCSYVINGVELDEEEEENEEKESGGVEEGGGREEEEEEGGGGGVRKRRMKKEKLYEMLEVMSLCHTAQIDIFHEIPGSGVKKQDGGKEEEKDLTNKKKDEQSQNQSSLHLLPPFHPLPPLHPIPLYQASSPDEKALVEACGNLGVVFQGIKEKTVTLSVYPSFFHNNKNNNNNNKNNNNINEENDIDDINEDDDRNNNMNPTTKRFILHGVLQFDSDRKRMSVLVEEKDKGRYRVICKGADTSVEQCLKGGHGNDLESVKKKLKNYAKKGFRTLMFAHKDVTSQEMKNYVGLLKRAQENIKSKQNDLQEAYRQIERNMEIVGCTGIEDQLQEDVHLTISALRRAGMQIWVLTGDKEETAENVSSMAGHMTPEMTPYHVTNQESRDGCYEVMKVMLEDLKTKKLTKAALVIDGKSLTYALSDNEVEEVLRELCIRCVSALFCRLSPIQKSQVVRMVKTHPDQPITAAVGDGANDVNMIQEAHVGIGIKGKEGRQAARSSDFSICKFKHLSRLILVHGSYFYYRLAILVLYFFYKNVVLTWVQMLFNCHSSFSAQTYFSNFILTFYNTTFTALPILLFGIFEKHLPEGYLSSMPSLYRKLKKNRLLSLYNFVKWNLLGIFHATVCFYGVYLASYYSTSILPNSKNIGLYDEGTLCVMVVVLVVNFKLAVETHHFTWIIASGFFISILGFYVLLLSNASIITLSLEETIKLHWSVYVLLSAATPWLLKVLLITTSLLPDFIMRSVNDTIIFTKKIVPKNKDGGCLVSASKGGCYNNKAFCDL